jgi:small subunit ribosomal protein S9
LTPEEHSQHTPLIEPNRVKDVIKPAPAAASASAKSSPKKATANELAPGQYCWGTGRRKKAIARVRIRPGKGDITINKRTLDEYFPNQQTRMDVRAPMVATNTVDSYDVFITVHGGGFTGQAGAAKLGMARALAVADPTCYTALKNNGYLTRDSRMKERKKYGQRGARRSFQFSKR